MAHALGPDPDFQERLVAAGALDAISAAIVGESARVGTGEGPDAKAQGAEDLLLAALASAYFLAAGSERHASGATGAGVGGVRFLSVAVL